MLLKFQAKESFGRELDESSFFHSPQQKHLNCQAIFVPTIRVFGVESNTRHNERQQQRRRRCTNGERNEAENEENEIQEKWAAADKKMKIFHSVFFRLSHHFEKIVLRLFFCVILFYFRLEQIWDSNSRTDGKTMTIRASLWKYLIKD